MDINLIALAIPFFFLLIGVELVIAHLQGVRVYRFNDAVTDLSCGIGNQVTGVFMKTALFAAYFGVYEAVHLLDLSASWWGTWILGALGVDVAYYWWHRTSHRVNFVWATHVPHHQSQDYNLAVALRQAWFSRVTSAPFYLVLAVFGIPPVVYAINDAVNTLYQFWIHTETVKKMGPLEAVLNTPSHHRVHHGVNPRYIDKNYAGMLIIWDKLFGTFEPESEPVCYGTVKVYKSWNPIWANFDHWAYLVEEARQSKRWVDKVGVFFRPPEWRAADRPPLPQAQEVSPDSVVKWDTPTAPGLAPYVFVHFAAMVVATTGMLFVEETASWAALGTLGLVILWTTVNWGGLFEGRTWAVPSEAARLAVCMVLMVGWGLSAPGVLPVVAGAVVILALSGMWVLRHSTAWAWNRDAVAPVTTPQVAG